MSQNPFCSGRVSTRPVPGIIPREASRRSHFHFALTCLFFPFNYLKFYYIIIKFNYSSPEQNRQSPRSFQRAVNRQVRSKRNWFRISNLIVNSGCKLRTGRKVRAPQGKVLHNTESRQREGKCHRKGNHPERYRGKGEKVSRIAGFPDHCMRRER
jgi:hypothetical protein